MNLPATLLAAAEPPLDPGGEEARRSLRRELARPEYYDADLLERITRWLEDLVGRSVGAAADAPALTTAAAVVVALTLVALTLLLVSRARRTARAGRGTTPALSGERVTAGELRARAEAALAAGDASAALVDAFRASAVRQVERGRIDDTPQATAHELAGALAAAFPAQAAALADAADVFDAVLYGDRPATAEQARELLDLDDLLAGRTARR